MHKLLQVNQESITTGTQKFTKQALCEWCSDSEVEVVATSYCIECDQHIFDRCSLAHKKAKAMKSHKVVREGDIPSSENRSKFALSYCDEHLGEQNRCYCYDCKVVTCHLCFFKKHKRHDGTDVNESAEKCCEQLNEDVNKLSLRAIQEQAIMTKLQENRNSFVEMVATTQREISQKYDQLISLLQSHQSLLMEELQMFQIKTLKEMETQKDETERQFMITESFKRYCQEIINKGTACDISRMAHDLHARAEELVKTQDEPDCHQLNEEVEIKFKPSVVKKDIVKNCIGKLIFRGQINFLMSMHFFCTYRVLNKQCQTLKSS